MIVLDKIYKSYGKNKNILQGLSLKIEPSNIISFVSPNGCGKTTLLIILSNLIYYDKGNIKSTNEYKAVALIEEPIFYHHLTGFQNLAYLLEKSEIHKVYELINLFQMKNFINNKVSIYSLGMKQRLALCYLFSVRANLVLLDEPMSALDPIEYE